MGDCVIVAMDDSGNKDGLLQNFLSESHTSRKLPNLSGFAPEFSALGETKRETEQVKAKIDP